jgi:hypothetical protein
VKQLLSKPYSAMTEAERQVFRETLFSSEATEKTAQKLAQEYAETGDSVFGTAPDYPGEVLEWTFDGKVFIVQKQQGSWQRLREVLKPSDML